MSAILLLGALLLVAAIFFMMRGGSDPSGSDPNRNFPMMANTVYKQKNGNFAFRTPPGEPLAPNTHTGQKVEWVLSTTRSSHGGVQPATISWEDDTLKLRTGHTDVQIPNLKTEVPQGMSQPAVYESQGSGPYSCIGNTNDCL